jgi:hypothetical protein
MRRISETGFLVYTVIKIRTSCQALNHRLGHCRERFETVPYRLTPRHACPALGTEKDEGAVVTDKEQLLAHPRDGERAGMRCRWAFFNSMQRVDILLIRCYLRL